MELSALLDAASEHKKEVKLNDILHLNYSDFIFCKYFFPANIFI
jgi:hypothetical protein